MQVLEGGGGEARITNASKIGGEFELLEDHLVAICLQCREDIGGFSQNQVGLVRITLAAAISARRSGARNGMRIQP